MFENIVNIVNIPMLLMCELNFSASVVLVVFRLIRFKFKLPLNEKNTLAPNDKMATGTSTNPVRMARFRYPTKQIPVILLPSTSLNTNMVTVNINGKAHAMK